ncbi:glycosyltransferase family 4 protein [Microbacterium sp. cx-55]|uniref:glycosyltransferase family 4 protein n=1 Tax=Microbacterium sp. cx-55 TaxID=2875948 RepID=UPI001CBB64FF|nr:glycosyltransferase family 4 protein [Microbacterium sp. cx-55]MBZ4486841.1 glycosyltransferase family 4 protein [Microbacterium sp. cx-55]UGB35770.1 glycosyltransferase family 4 protein [Microbacterium sp. cx-55]
MPDWVDVYRIGPAHAARTTTGRGLSANLSLSGTILRSAVALLRSRAVRGADVLVANTTRASVYVSLVGVLLRKPVIVHIRDLIERDAIGGTATRLMTTFVLPNAAAIIANSHASLALATPHIRDGSITAVIPSPSGLKVVDADVVRVSPRVKRIGLVARIDPWKGQELLIQAFADALPDSDEVLVLFGAAAFGHDEYLAELQRMTRRLGVEDRVEFAGHVDDVAAAIAGLDVCVQCSMRPEPLGQNVLQYLAAGKPTIVANEGGPSEWVDDGRNGLTFSARSVGSLSAALRKLCDDAILREKFGRAAASTPGLLSDEAVGSRILNLTRDVLVSSKR